ncbi:MAG TPA: glutamate mutase L [Candidatus Aminicenantes bacterium]|nr:glutamate mutase L [Candidatus Aminicenantes bacterium]HRY65632.1 glutamate mutase L [Candidatus Aminicenantes bacterium]HRZ72480.1 glutamate mutase L [Candidatus Aminicenantes bacterium]
MAATPLLSVDIGSTYTKGGLFLLEGEELRCAGRRIVPTTVDDLAQGFFRVRQAVLAGHAGAAGPADVPVYWSSSARGGLKIAAVGLTPDLTLSVARMAATSAGGKIVRAFSYELAPEDLAELEAVEPDIILFTGGTDGGNSRVVLHNAARLAGLVSPAVVLYAGNRKVRDQVLDLLRGRDVETAANVMPEVGTIDIEPARDVIRRIFLDRIVDGKGLSSVVEATGREPLPTPLAVFELVRTIAARVPGWEDFALIDMGGATTDFYSHTKAFHGGDSVILRGLLEPTLKRTVEGDLGLRVSAEALYRSESAFLDSRLRAAGTDPAALRGYVDEVSRRTDYLPGDGTGRGFDRLLAAACVRAASLRHAGVLQRVFTPQGGFQVQRGKDLRRVRRLVGSGGYLAGLTDPAILLEACPTDADDVDTRHLVPEAPACYADAEYLIPLLGNLAADFPGAAGRAAVAGLRPLGPRTN